MRAGDDVLTEKVRDMDPVPSDMTKFAAKPAGSAVGEGRSSMRAAVDRALKIGPGFLSGEIDADTMATTMVQAVRDYAALEAAYERANGARPGAADPRDAEWRGVLAELMTCGSGYLAGRCDADCVARTMTSLVHEYAAG